MKKNNMMRLASVLLVLVLLTTCAISGTFAKYITANEATDTARVAHWGFTSAGVIEFKLFDTSADTGIQTISGTNLIAPGSNDSVQFTLVNADATTNPEVAYKITVDTTGSSTSIDAELEEAVTFYLDDDTQELTWVELIAAIKALSGHESGSKEYAPGAAVPTALTNATTHEIGWNWEFERGDDAGDTGLGNHIVEELAKLQLKIKVTAEQLDTYTVTP